MFTRVHLVSSVLTPNNTILYAPYVRGEDSKIINTNSIIDIVLESDTPRMDSQHQKLYAKIFDKSFKDLAIFNIKYCDGTNNLIIAPIEQYKKIK